MPRTLRPGGRAAVSELTLALCATLVALATACAQPPEKPDSTWTVGATGAAASAGERPGATNPLPVGLPVDHLIQPEERHFAHLWQLTRGGENAEGYFSFEGDRIVFQRRNQAEGVHCDRIYLLGSDVERPEQKSDGRGTTTCAYFYPGGKRILYASTREHTEDCPPPPDFSQGYVWSLWPEFDLWARDLETGDVEQLTDEWGYDAEATISPTGEKIVFTSSRSGDLELWTCDLDGSNLLQVTDALGYDGGAFFSHDGKQLVFRATAFTPGAEEAEQAAYRELLADWRVRPGAMEIMLIDADGSNRRQLTQLGGANFAPFFFPDDKRVIFATNHHEESARNFDLFAIGVDGEGLERITNYEGFDSFPMFSPDGRFLIFASNRGGTERGETNLFLAAWK
jgi:TolB protein